MPRKSKRKKIGAPSKNPEDKSYRKDFTLKGEVIAIAEAHKTFGFKSASAMVSAGLISLARQRTAKTFASNLLPDKNGLD